MTYLSIHKSLANAEVAPKLLGLVDGSSSATLTSTDNYNWENAAVSGGFDVNMIRAQPLIGVLMEEIPLRWHLNREQPLPAFVKSWTKVERNRALDSISKIEEVIRNSNILPEDLQLVVKPNGQAVLIDLDGFKINTTDQVFAGFDKEKAKIRATFN